jgi:hypothetical protein
VSFDTIGHGERRAPRAGVAGETGALEPDVVGPAFAAAAVVHGEKIPARQLDDRRRVHVLVLRRQDEAPPEAGSLSAQRRADDEGGGTRHRRGPADSHTVSP